MGQQHTCVAKLVVQRTQPWCAHVEKRTNVREDMTPVCRDSARKRDWVKGKSVGVGRCVCVRGGPRCEERKPQLSEIIFPTNLSRR